MTFNSITLIEEKNYPAFYLVVIKLITPSSPSSQSVRCLFHFQTEQI